MISVGDAKVDHLRYVSPILPRLWMSGMPQPTWPLVDWGVDVLVTLSEHLPPQAARRFEWGTCGDAVGAGRLVFMHWPIDDGPLPDEAATQIVVSTVVNAVRGGRTVLVHCAEGRNRSGLVVALAVRELLGVDGRAAVEYVRSVRSGVLYNRAFAAYLMDLPTPT